MNGLWERALPLYYVHMDMHALLFCRRLNRFGKDFLDRDESCAAWLRFRGFPCLPNNVGGRHTLLSVAYLFAVTEFPNVGRNDPKGSVLKSAHLRINAGHVLHVRCKGRAPGATLQVSVQSSMSKKKTYLVECNMETLALSDSCVNRSLAEVGDECGHQRMVPTLLHRIQQGFERIVYANKGGVLFDDSEKQLTRQLLEVDAIFLERQYQRLVLKEAVRVAKRRRVYEETKHHLLAKDGVRSIVSRPYTIRVQPRKVDPGLFRRARAARERLSSERQDQASHGPAVQALENVRSKRRAAEAARERFRSL